MASLKLIVMGAGGVGKSAITLRFTQGPFITNYDPTIEDQHTKPLEVDGQAFNLEILDTAGQAEYRPLRQTFMDTGDGFILVYSITDDQTFEELAEIHQEILEIHPQGAEIPIMLVGNKNDLESDRAVTREEGENLAAQFGTATFLEASAKNNFMVSEVFTNLVREILKRNPEAGTGGGAAVFGAGAVDSSVAESKGEASKQKKKKRRKFCTIL